MKTNIFPSLKWFVSLFILVFFLVTAQATEVTVLKDVKTNPIEIKYTGLDKNELHAFSVHYNNVTGGTFSVQILNENGESLFIGRYSDKVFEKTFKLSKQDIESVQFVFRDEKSNTRERYFIKIVSQIVEDIQVNRIN